MVPLEIWVVYKGLAEYPGKFVAIKHMLDRATEAKIVKDTLTELRNALPKGLVCLTRHPNDNETVVETWL